MEAFGGRVGGRDAGDPEGEGLFEQRPGGSESRREPRQRDGRAKAQARTCRCVQATAEQSAGTMGGGQAGRGGRASRASPGRRLTL